MTSFEKFKSIFALLCLFFVYSNGCKCIVVDTSKPSFLCKAEYILAGEIQSEETIGDISNPLERYKVYMVNVSQIYKGLSKIKEITNGNTSIVTIKTLEDSAACGVTLPLNKHLIISGRFGVSDISIRSCSGWHKDFNSLSKEFTDFLSDMDEYCTSVSPTTPSNTCGKLALNLNLALGFIALFKVLLF